MNTTEVVMHVAECDRMRGGRSSISGPAPALSRWCPHCGARHMSPYKSEDVEDE